MADAAYPRATWRVIVETEPRTGAWNMAVDEAIALAVAAGAAPPTLRFYQWEPPCLSLGRRQPLDGVELARCRADGVDVARRPTGGWAILHTDELTYSVAAPPDDPRAAGPILDAYRRLSAGLVDGLRRLGAPVAMSPVDPRGTHNLSAACFEVPSAYELTVGPRKLMGSAQARRAGYVLQHGSLPLRGDIARVAEYLAYPDEAARDGLRRHLRERAVTLGEVLGRPVGFDEAARAFRDGFAAALALDLVPGPLYPEEQAAAAALVDEVAVAVIGAPG